jgi:hypothetical protein
VFGSLALGMTFLLDVLETSALIELYYDLLAVRDFVMILCLIDFPLIPTPLFELPRCSKLVLPLFNTKLLSSA